MTIQKPDFNQIFASQAPAVDKPPVFNNYNGGWGDESRPNNGKPTIKGFNYIQNLNDNKFLWMVQNGAALPYDATIEYAENAHVVKDGELQKKQGESWVSVANKGYNLDYFASGKSYPLHAEIMLDSGVKVASTVPNNTKNPNLNMTGWAIVATSREQLGITNVDNTSDLSKPVSNLTQAAIYAAVKDKATIESVAHKADKTYVDELIINANNGITNYQTQAELLAFVPTTANYTAKALDTKKVWLWDGVQWNDTGLSELDLAREYVDEKIQYSDKAGLDFVSEDNFKFARISNNVLDISTVLMTKDDNIKGLSVESKDGFNLLDNVEKFKVERTQDGLISFVSKDGFKLQTDPKAESESDIENIVNELIKPVPISINQPLFTDLLVGFANEDININVECLIAQRALQRKQRTVTAAISASNLNYFKQSTEMLSIQADRIEGAAKLYLRDISAYSYTVLDLTVKSVAKSGLSGSPKILMVGDSITNRGGAAIVDSVLREAGMTPSFIGTITGAGTNEAALGTAGKLNEGREGWRTTQFTNALADKTPVPVGGESAYMALVKNDKIKWNPFIREATSSDNASIIKNGYVLDFEFYLSRFALDTPDVVVLQLGTNDVVYAPTTSEQNVYDNILLIMQQLRVAFPSCKIIVSSVGRAISTETTDAQYDSLYPPVFRSTQKAIKDSGLSNVYFCPSFAIADTFTGFPVTATETDAISGAITGTYSDGLHPTYSGRQTLYTNIAAYIAAGATNII